MGKREESEWLREKLTGNWMASKENAEKLIGLLNDLRSLGRPDSAEKTLEELYRTEMKFFWPKQARMAQMAPPGARWTTWLILGGRGAGKTRAGSEWIKSRIEAGVSARVALVGESFENIREVMVEGVSGLLSISPSWRRPAWYPSLHKLAWPNGATAHCFSAEDPDSLRGHQFDTAWSDELAAWRQPDDVWSNLQLGLRLPGSSGEPPRQVITTTPRPIPLLKRIMAQEMTTMTHMTTWENEANLAASFMSEIIAQYEGTRLGRQELLGEVLEDIDGAMWQRSWIEEGRVDEMPPLRRVVVAVDPPTSSGPGADECGIVVAGVTGDGEYARGFVLADMSAGGLSPADWASRVVAAYHQFSASRIVVESNQGGEMAEQVLRQVEANLPINRVYAVRSKQARAEPVAALYERGRIHHCGTFPALEDQLIGYTGRNMRRGSSPDRLDALVWVLTELLVKPHGSGPRIHFLTDRKNKT